MDSTQYSAVRPAAQRTGSFNGQISYMFIIFLVCNSLITSINATKFICIPSLEPSVDVLDNAAL